MIFSEKVSDAAVIDFLYSERIRIGIMATDRNDRLCQLIIKAYAKWRKSKNLEDFTALASLLSDYEGRLNQFYKEVH